MNRKQRDKAPEQKRVLRSSRSTASRPLPLQLVADISLSNASQGTVRPNRRWRGAHGDPAQPGFVLATLQP